jgi:hypothetical protein
MSCHKRTSPSSFRMLFFWLSAFLLGLLVWYVLLSACFAADTWLPKDKWSLIYTNTEETIGADHRAINAFDGKPDTLWHSEWKVTKKAHPHEIQIDLGASYLIDGFSYLPRQQNTNWHVKDYLFYVSENKANFGTPVAAGAFSNGRTEKVVSLATPKQGRYISFVAVNDLTNSGFHTAMAELGVSGTNVVIDVKEFTEADLRVIFEPSPDIRATGHKLYWTNTVTNKTENIDLKKAVSHIIPKGTLIVGNIYKFTATAYGLVDGKAAESVHSDPMYVKLKKAEDPLVKPSAPRITELKWDQP